MIARIRPTVVRTRVLFHSAQVTNYTGYYDIQAASQPCEFRLMQFHQIVIGQ